MLKRMVRGVLLPAACVGLSAGWCAIAAAAPGAASAAPAAPTAAPAPTGPIRVAIANPAHIFNDMAETKSLQAEMADEQKKFQATQADKVNEIKAMRDKRDNLLPDHPQWAELNGQLSDMTVKYKVWVETQKAMAENQQKEKMRRLFQKIEDACAEVARRDGIDLVIADNRDPLPSNMDEIDVRTFRGMILQRDVLFSSSRVDISQEVLTVLDAKYRSAGGSPPPSLPGNPSGPFIPH